MPILQYLILFEYRYSIIFFLPSDINIRILFLYQRNINCC